MKPPRDAGPHWPYGPPDLEPEPVPVAEWRGWIVWGLVVLLLSALALTCIGLAEAMRPQHTPAAPVDHCANV